MEVKSHSLKEVFLRLKSDRVKLGEKGQPEVTITQVNVQRAPGSSV